MPRDALAAIRSGQKTVYKFIPYFSRRGNDYTLPTRPYFEAWNLIFGFPEVMPCREALKSGVLLGLSIFVTAFLRALADPLGEPRAGVPANCLPSDEFRFPE